MNMFGISLNTAESVLLIIFALIFYIVGIGVGNYIGKRKHRIKSVGILRVDNSDKSEPPYLFLELNNIEDIYLNDYVQFEVKIEDYIPRK